MEMIKLVIGLLTYKLKNRKYYKEDFTVYPKGRDKLYDSLEFLGDLRGTIWSLWMMMVSFF